MRRKRISKKKRDKNVSLLTSLVKGLISQVFYKKEQRKSGNDFDETAEVGCHWSGLGGLGHLGFTFRDEIQQSNRWLSEKISKIRLPKNFIR